MAKKSRYVEPKGYFSSEMVKAGKKWDKEHKASKTSKKKRK